MQLIIEDCDEDLWILALHTFFKNLFTHVFSLFIYLEYEK